MREVGVAGRDHRPTYPYTKLTFDRLVKRLDGSIYIHIYIYTCICFSFYSPQFPRTGLSSEILHLAHSLRIS